MSDDRKPRRVFSAEFKTEAARLVVDQGMRKARAARDLGVGEVSPSKLLLQEQARSLFIKSKRC